MIYECAQLADLMIDAEEKSKKATEAGDEALAKKYASEAHVLDERLGFLTPMLKGFLTEAGKEAAGQSIIIPQPTFLRLLLCLPTIYIDLGIQVYGGHGYIKDNHAELNYRDVRIAPVWEGTTQIQGLDLLGRKILVNKLKPINEHCAGLRAQVELLAIS